MGTPSGPQASMCSDWPRNGCKSHHLGTCSRNGLQWWCHFVARLSRRAAHAGTRCVLGFSKNCHAGSLFRLSTHLLMRRVIAVGMRGSRTSFCHWGSQAFADAFGAHLSIITSYEDSCVIEIAPSTPVNHRRPLWLSFWAEVHYNSLHLPHGETPHGTGDLGSSDAARIRQTKLARGLVRRCFGGLCYAVPQAVR